ncbi:uncharacterized protein LOC101852422 [Aplysia californica]|uniref:Lengsin n=2 Tax=Aplysia californica TaxID=6500 RepID=A0ABM1VW64_APLCA|nr:uncharacterized protein LOC101852422 [Aplysia californica]
MENKAHRDVVDFEYIQLVVYDIHCRPLGRLCYSTIDGKYFYHSHLMDICDKFLMPDMSTLIACPRPLGTPQTVGRVLCDLEFFNGTRDFFMELLNELKQMNVQIETLQPETNNDFFEVTLDVAEGIEQMNVPTETLLPEARSTSETTSRLLRHVYSLTSQAADGTALFKSHVKTFSKRKGYVASFMSKVDKTAYFGIGLHFNHSLWTLDGANMLVDDPNEHQCEPQDSSFFWSPPHSTIWLSRPADCGPQASSQFVFWVHSTILFTERAGKRTNSSRRDTQRELSDVARHWIAGLVKHGPGLTALCMPTVNCYRRIGKERLPTRSDWSVLDKNATFVVRKTRKNNIYAEDRLPSSAGNPYLVMAATVAAGIDGIRNKIPLQNKTEDFCVLPPDLETALTCLQEDAVLVDALGKDLVELFVATKTMEIHHLKSMEQTSGTDSFQNEYHLYFQNA